MKNKHPRTCQYCGRVIEKPVIEKVWVNGEQREMVFCSEDCAAYRQMSAEG